MQFFYIVCLSLLAPTISGAFEWSGFKGCGTYQARGIGRSTPNGLVMVINEKSQSEIVLSVTIKNEVVLAPYIDRAFTAIVKIEKMDGSKSTATINEIKSRLPNPINPNDTGLKFIGKSSCQ